MRARSQASNGVLFLSMHDLKQSKNLLDGASGSPGEEANGPGVRASRVHHVLVELDKARLKQPYQTSQQPLCQCRHQPTKGAQ